MRLIDAAPAAMPDVKNSDRIAVDGVEHPVLMGFAPVNELTDLKGKLLALRGERVTVRKIGKRRYRVFQLKKPSQARLSCTLLQQPFQNTV